MINIQNFFRDCDLIKTYYLNIIDDNLRLYRLIYKLKEFRKFPKKELPERLLIIVAQYLYPHISYSSVDSWLDNIVQKVLIYLKSKHPAHSIFSVSSEQFSIWRNNHIDDNFWNPTEATQIRDILEELLFSEIEYSLQLDQLFITLNLKKCVKDFVSFKKLSLI